MAHKMRQQRRTPVKQMSFANERGETDVLDYQPNGNRFKFSYYPPLSETGFPVVEGIEVQLRPGTEAPPNRIPIERGYRLLFEHENQLFAAYIFAVHGGRLPLSPGEESSEAQTIGIVADMAGKVLFTEQGPELSRAGDYLLNSFKFRNSAKKTVTPKQTVHPIDEETLTHEFTCEVSAPGGLRYTHKGKVSELRKRGIFGGQQPFFKEAVVWEIEGKHYAIIKDHDGFFHAAEMNSTGGKRIACTTRHHDALGAIMSYHKDFDLRQAEEAKAAQPKQPPIQNKMPGIKIRHNSNATISLIEDLP